MEWFFLLLALIRFVASFRFLYRNRMVLDKHSRHIHIQCGFFTNVASYTIPAKRLKAVLQFWGGKTEGQSLALAEAAKLSGFPEGFLLAVELIGSGEPALIVKKAKTRKSLEEAHEKLVKHLKETFPEEKVAITPDGGGEIAVPWTAMGTQSFTDSVPPLKFRSDKDVVIKGKKQSRFTYFYFLFMSFCLVFFTLSPEHANPQPAIIAFSLFIAALMLLFAIIGLRGGFGGRRVVVDPSLAAVTLCANRIGLWQATEEVPLRNIVGVQLCSKNLNAADLKLRHFEINLISTAGEGSRIHLIALSKEGVARESAVRLAEFLGVSIFDHSRFKERAEDIVERETAEPSADEEWIEQDIEKTAVKEKPPVLLDDSGVEMDIPASPLGKNSRTEDHLIFVSTSSEAAQLRLTWAHYAIGFLASAMIMAIGVTVFVWYVAPDRGNLFLGEWIFISILGSAFVLVGLGFLVQFCLSPRLIADRSRKRLRIVERIKLRRKKKREFALDEILALQLCSRQVSDKNGTYMMFELNLVLAQPRGERLYIYSQKSWDRIKPPCARFAEFIGKPLLDHT